MALKGCSVVVGSSSVVVVVVVGSEARHTAAVSIMYYDYALVGLATLR